MKGYLINLKGNAYGTTLRVLTPERFIVQGSTENRIDMNKLDSQGYEGFLDISFTTTARILFGTTDKLTPVVRVETSNPKLIELNSDFISSPNAEMGIVGWIIFGFNVLKHKLFGVN